jgi:2-phospho-L-lactate/phosphoenolpyruvate guanylyltransferase
VDAVRWTVLIPMRALPHAKSRLAATLPDGLHAEAVAAIRADTLTAVEAVPSVARVLVIGDVAGEGIALVQHSIGLNGALRDGFEYALAHWPRDGVAALVGDLPALQADELAAALDAAAAQPCSFVADSTGTGTTLLTARPGARLDPRFGPGSAARHAEVAAPLPAGAGLRQDVDTAADLVEAARLGIGLATAALLHDERVVRRSH